MRSHHALNTKNEGKVAFFVMKGYGGWTENISIISNGGTIKKHTNIIKEVRPCTI